MLFAGNVRGKIAVWVFAFTMTAVLAACATKVTRISPDEVKDLSGYWNDTDSQLVSKEMIQDALEQPWLGDYTRRHSGKPPVVIVGTIRNLSVEHINTDTFVTDMQRALINSGKVEFVAAGDQRGEVREERKDQDINAREDTRKAMGQEVGADFMMKGSINMIVDQSGDTNVRYYQVDLNLISLADNRIVWVGQKKIKKVVEKAKLRF
jgi:uncharacterized protein (TIGR02722 family)